MSDQDYFKRAIKLSMFDRIAFNARCEIFKMFVALIRPQENEKIIDIGVFAGSSDPEQNYLEKYYDHPENITAVGIEDAFFLEKQYPGLKFIKIRSGHRLPFEDDHFDIGFSSAVIEHVGSIENQRYFLKESSRVCRRLFLTTPNRFYPIEFHTRLPLLHWLPKPCFRYILKLIKLEFYSKEENLNLLSKKDLMSLVWPDFSGKMFLHSFRLFGMISNYILLIEK